MTKTFTIAAGFNDGTLSIKNKGDRLKFTIRNIYDDEPQSEYLSVAAVRRLIEYLSASLPASNEVERNPDDL